MTSESRAITEKVHTIVWAFSVEPSFQAAFEAAYGPHGDWAQLFGRSDGYLGTELYKNTTNPNGYITVDRWKSVAHFQAFKQSQTKAYNDLDARCEAWTLSEVTLCNDL